jgi:hypothetical protein
VAGAKCLINGLKAIGWEYDRDMPGRITDGEEKRRMVVSNIGYPFSDEYRKIIRGHEVGCEDEHF